MCLAFLSTPHVGLLLSFSPSFSGLHLDICRGHVYFYYIIDFQCMIPSSFSLSLSWIFSSICACHQASKGEGEVVEVANSNPIRPSRRKQEKRKLTIFLHFFFLLGIDFLLKFLITGDSGTGKYVVTTMEVFQLISLLRLTKEPKHSFRCEEVENRTGRRAHSSTQQSGCGAIGSQSGGATKTGNKKSKTLNTKKPWVEIARGATNTKKNAIKTMRHEQSKQQK